MNARSRFLSVALLLLAPVVKPVLASATTFTVNTTEDASRGDCTTSPDGCTLRDAIAQVALGPSGNHDNIDFNIPFSDPGYNSVTKVFQITVSSALPHITGANVIIDGSTQTTNDGLNNTTGVPIEIAAGAAISRGLYVTDLAGTADTVENLAVNGFGTDLYVSSGYVTVTNCYFGVTPAGTAASPHNNVYYPFDLGIYANATLALSNSLIENSKGWGVEEQGADSPEITNCTVTGNSGGGIWWQHCFTGGIGGSTISNNGAGGILLDNSFSCEVSTNTITNNTGVGISLVNQGEGDGVANNSIYGNTGLGIDLDGDGVTPNQPLGSTGADHDLPYPVLTYVSANSYLTATLTAKPSHAYTLEFYGSPTGDPSGYGQGQTADIASQVVTTNSSGVVSINVPRNYAYVTATTTDNVTGDTSEFSNWVPGIVTPPPTSFDFASATASINATKGSINVTVLRQGTATAAASVRYGTSNGPEYSGAQSGVNYTTTNGLLSWAAGNSTSQTVSIPILDASGYSAGSTLPFTITLFSPTGGTVGSTGTETITIYYQAAPGIGTFAPNPATGGWGAEQIITGNYYDDQTPSNLNRDLILINTTNSPTSALEGYYNISSNLLYLRNDGNTAWLGGYAPGSAHTISNSQGTLNCADCVIGYVPADDMYVRWAFTPTESFAGNKNVYGYTLNNDGLSAGFTLASTWNIAVADTAPTLNGVTPLDGSSHWGGTITVTSSYADANSASDIAGAELLINANSNPAAGIFGYYDQATNLLYLRNDGNTAWLGGFAPGSAHTISNSQGTLNCAATSVTTYGDYLLVTWSFTPVPSFDGPMGVYGYVVDNEGLSAGITQEGNWTIDSDDVAPQLGSVTPGSGTSTAGTAYTLTASYGDGNGAGDISQADLLINTTNNNATGFLVRYDQGLNQLFIRNSANTAWVGGFAPGSANVISNSLGSLNCAATTVSTAENTLTVAFNLTPNPGLVGSQNVYAFAQDHEGQTAGASQEATWTIQAPTSGLATVTKSFSGHRNGSSIRPKCSGTSGGS